MKRQPTMELSLDGELKWCRGTLRIHNVPLNSSKRKFMYPVERGRDIDVVLYRKVLMGLKDTKAQNIEWSISENEMSIFWKGGKYILFLRDSKKREVI